MSSVLPGVYATTVGKTAGIVRHTHTTYQHISTIHDGKPGYAIGRSILGPRIRNNLFRT